METVRHEKYDWIKYGVEKSIRGSWSGRYLYYIYDGRLRKNGVWQSKETSDADAIKFVRKIIEELYGFGSNIGAIKHPYNTKKISGIIEEYCKDYNLKPSGFQSLKRFFGLKSKYNLNSSDIISFVDIRNSEGIKKNVIYEEVGKFKSLLKRVFGVEYSSKIITDDYKEKIKEPCVYFIGDIDEIKIGCSEYPYQRIPQALRFFKQAEVLLVLPTDNCKSLEKELHERFSKYLIRGKEFFNLQRK